MIRFGQTFRGRESPVAKTAWLLRYIGSGQLRLRHAVEILAFHGRLFDPPASELSGVTAYNSGETGGRRRKLPHLTVVLATNLRPTTNWSQECDSNPTPPQINLQDTKQQIGVQEWGTNPSASIKKIYGTQTSGVLDNLPLPSKLRAVKFYLIPSTDHGGPRRADTGGF